MTTMLPADHAERLALAAEVHARPPEPVETPSRVSYVAVLVPPERREAEHAHLAALCRSFGVEPPAAERNHFSATLGALRLKWERHGEFSGYTVVTAGLSPRPFSEPVAALLPEGWLAGIPGRTVFAAHAKLAPAPERTPDVAELAGHFDGHIVVGAAIGDGAGYAFTDFHIHADGFARFLVLDRGFTPRQAGRMLQRLFEIEAYRMMALLALPQARAVLPRMGEIERALAALARAIARDEAGEGPASDEALLHELTRLAAEVESALASNQFRFGACRAYHALVTTRIAELREQRIPGLQTIEEFMARRLSPAVATVATVEQRLRELSERVAQASSLLATRVSIARERQNQALLAATARRAQLQLRLQQTVEGLSVAAIVYYVAGLLGYVAKGLKAAGVRLDPELAVGAAIPLLLFAAMAVVRRIHRRIAAAEARHAAGQGTRASEF